MHKLHHEFDVAAAQSVEVGQPVILNADGTVQAAAAGAAPHTIIGYSIHQGNAAELITVAMKAYIIIWASPKAATAAGPVKADGMNVTDATYTSVDDTTVTAANAIGWALDASVGADEIIRVALI